MPSPQRKKLALLGVSAVLLTVLCALLLDLGGGERAVGPEQVVPGLRAASAVLRDGPASTERELVLDADPFASDDVDVRPGVRLAGDGRLVGRVLDRATGAGVAGVRVDLLPITPSAKDLLGTMLRLARASERMDRRALPVAVTTSGADGAFAFEGVRPGTYFLDARGAYHVPDHLVRVRVARSGDGGPVDCYVRRGGRVVGRVVRADGTAAARATVAVFHGPGSAVAAFRDGELRRLDRRCERDGSFSVAGVTPGVGYEVHAFGPGFAVTHAAIGEVRAGEDTEVTIVVRQGVTVAGRVLAASGAGDGEAGPPLADVSVGAVPRGLRDLSFAEEIFRYSSARTDAQGRYTLPHVPPGEVELVASQAGRLDATSPVLVLPETGRVLAPDLLLGAGPLLRGRVVDRAGAPIAGVHVRWFTSPVAYPDSFDFSFASLMHQGLPGFEFPVSDADGRFVAGPFPGEAPHNFYLGKSGYAYTRATWDPAQGDELEVVLHRGGAVEGIVMDLKAAQPVTSFLVTGAARIDRRFDEPSSMNPFSGGELIETPDGRFRLEGILAGDAEITFSAPGYHKETVQVDVLEGETKRGVIVKLVAGGTVSGAVVDAAGEPVAGAQVATLRGGAWSLQRSFERIGQHYGSGRYTDTMEESVSNAMVSFATRLGSLGEDSETTAVDGSFTLESVLPGPFAVVVKHRAYALGQSEELVLTEGATIDGLELVLSQGASLFGRITDRFDRPLSQALVFAVSPSEFSGDGGPGAAVYQGIADTEGNYEVLNMRGGAYVVSSFRADANLNPLAIASTMQFDLVNVPAETRVRYDVVDLSAAACRVFGTVSSGGELITSGGIVALGFDSENALGVDVKATQVSADGTYVFPGLAPGAYQFLYQGGDSELRVDVDVPELPEVRIDVALPWGGIAGVVVDARTGARLGGGRVSARNLEEREMDGLLAMFVYNAGQDRRARVDADGRFELRGLQPGRYGLTVDRAGRGGAGAPQAGYAASEEVEVEVRANETTSGVELALEPALSIAGFVRDPGGAPIPLARVQAFASGAPGSPLALARSDEDGAFELRGLAAGEYELAAVADGRAETSLRCELLDTPLEGLELRLVEGAEVVLHVRGPDGAPVVGAVAVVFRGDGRPVTRAAPNRPGLSAWLAGEAASDAEGLLRPGRLGPGTYRIEVRRGASARSLDGITVVADDLRLELDVELP